MAKIIKVGIIGCGGIANGKHIDPITLPEQALCVTRILKGIYTSAKTGKFIGFKE